MKIGNVMSRDVQLVKPDDTIRSAAALMKKIDAGLLPVTENDQLVGMITDRDIAIRGVAEGKGPDAKVRDATPLGPLQHPGDRRRHVAYIDRLQSGEAAAKHRKN